MLCLPLLCTALCILVPDHASQLLAGDSMGYAKWLMKEKDYFRAISEYKRILFETDDTTTRFHCLMQIAKAYYRSNKYRPSIQYLSRALGDPEASAEVKWTANLYLGLDYYEMKTPVLANQYFRAASELDTTGLPDLYLSLLVAGGGAWCMAGSSYAAIARSHTGTEIGIVARELAELSYRGDSIDYRSPALAAVFSSLFPGSGQIYCDHYYDGMQAFLYVGGFALASYAAYRYDRDLNNNYVSTYAALSVTSVFYIGNILGAMKTAEYRNLKLKQKHLQVMRERLLSLEP